MDQRTRVQRKIQNIHGVSGVMVLFRELDLSQEEAESRYLWSTNCGLVRCVILRDGVVKGGGCILFLLMSLPSVFETDTNGSERSPVANLSQLHRNFLDSVDPPSVQGPSLLKVLLTGLRPDTDYSAIVYSQAADGTEGQPGNEEVFTTSRLGFAKWLQPETPTKSFILYSSLSLDYFS